LEGPEIQFSEAVIDNGRFGKRVIRFETGRLAKQAAGAAMVYIDEDTALLSATTAGKQPREGFDFFPLTVDVEERMYAAGRIPGSFFRREGRPSTEAILACRLMDRPLRPAFVKGLRNEVQIVVTVLAINPASICLLALHPVIDRDPRAAGFSQRSRSRGSLPRTANA
jgi:polyribonucleotide nucleotidyltransferase